MTEVVADGYDVLRNVGYNDESWYLDNLNVNWSAVYANEPCADVPDALCPQILGGHGAMWGETVAAARFRPASTHAALDAAALRAPRLAGGGGGGRP